MSKALIFLLLILQQEPRKIVEDAQRRTTSQSQRYEGTLKVIDAKSKITEKRWIYDRTGSHGDSKAVLRFTAPAEVKGVALLIVNHPERASDQWMWTPAINRERRIAYQDRSTRFFGTDFSFEDLEERDTNQFDYKMLGDETVDGAACWKLQSTPKQTKASQYTHSFLWIRKDNYAFARIENYSKEQLVRRAHYTDIRNDQGIWTAHQIDMHDLKRNSHTILTIEKLQYNVPVKDEDFTLQALRRE
ncbi:MAG TPA: outer membrane lipoprotein-sorting protein [Terriglobia bacterium]|jgi:outer membrane lipoprotein-sorting protein